VVNLFSFLASAVTNPGYRRSFSACSDCSDCSGKCRLRRLLAALS